LVFHGGGGTGEGMARLTGFDALADREGMIVVYPDGIDHHWNDGRQTIKNKSDDVGFVRAILDAVEQHYAIAQGRIFATGISNGALFSQRLGCELADRIAAIAPVSGPMPADITPSCHPVRPVSVLQIEGTADPIMPYDGGHVADFGGRGEGGQVLSTMDTIAFWRRIDGCSAAPVTTAEKPLALLDSTRITRTQYGACQGSTRIELLTIEEGGHAWPGGAQYAPRFLIGKVSRQLDASAAILVFFLAH